MITEIDPWLDTFIGALKNNFGERVWFAGLQGSYGRGEAAEDSDIDMVVILDKLTAEDIASYHAMLDTLDHRELICGFLSGTDELMHWDLSDLFQFCHDTTPILGSLEPVLRKIDAEAVDRAILTGACNIYHGCVHNMLFGKREEALQGLYKAASFVIRALIYRRTGTFYRHLPDLLRETDKADRAVISAYIDMKQSGISDFQGQSGQLFAWAQEIITHRVKSNPAG